MATERSTSTGALDTPEWHLAARVVGPREWENMAIAGRFRLPDKVARICLVPGPLNRGEHWRNIYRAMPNQRRRRYLLCDFKGCRFASNLPYDLLLELLHDRGYLMKEHVPIEEQRMDVKVTDTKSPLYGEYKFYHPEEMDIYTSSSRPQSKAASKPAKGGAAEAPATRGKELDRTAFWNLLTPEGLDAMERGYFTPDDTKRMSTMVQQYLLRYYGRKILHAVCPLEWALRLPPEKLEVLCTEDGFRLLTVGLLTLPAIEKMDYVTMTSLFFGKWEARVGRRVGESRGSHDHPAEAHAVASHGRGHHCFLEPVDDARAGHRCAVRVREPAHDAKWALWA